MINNYQDFLLENVSVDLEFKLSHRLRDLLSQTEHPIAKKLLTFDDDKERTKFTLVDYDSDNVNNFTYASSNKLFDELMKDSNTKREIGIEKYNDVKNFINNKIQSIHEPYWKKYRTSTKIGRFVNKIFPKEFKQSGNPGHDLESFSNEIKNLRTKDDSRIKIVKGEELKQFYLKDNYNPSAFAGSSLGGSCMRDEHCQDYIDFYVINNVEMVVLLSKDDNTKIDARAILWTISNIDGDEIERKFMDRIYTIYDYDTNKLIDYAKKKGWLYKSKQTMNENEEICDPNDTTNDSCQRRDLRTSNNIKQSNNDKYPYMDTMKYFNIDYGYLTNEETGDRDVFVLEQTDGTYIMEGRIYSEYYGRWIDEEDLIWCEDEMEYRYSDDAVYIKSDEEWVTKEYAEKHCIYSRAMEEWLKDSETVHIKSIDDYVTEDYADEHFTWSQYEEEWLEEEDTVFSDYHDSYLNVSDSINVITEGGDDWRVDGDDTYFIYHNDKLDTNEPYDRYTMEDDFHYLYTYKDNNLDNLIQVYKHKEWDKEHLFKWNGRWFYDKIGKLKDRLTGQKRIWEKYR
jgi:hypothetical protein